MSKPSRDEIAAASSPISKRWRVVTSLQPDDFAHALAEHPRGEEWSCAPLRNSFCDVDTRWHWPTDAKLGLRLIGSTALMLLVTFSGEIAKLPVEAPSPAEKR